MRDPDGRGALTLEDLRYSTLPDLFRIVHRRGDQVDVDLRRRPARLPLRRCEPASGTAP